MYKLKTILLLIITSTIIMAANPPLRLTTANFTVNDDTNKSGFSVFWFTETSCVSELFYGKEGEPINNLVTDNRGISISDKLHIFELSNLEKNATYFFYIKNGTENYTNNNAFYSAKTLQQISMGVPNYIIINNITSKQTGTLISSDVLVISQGSSGSELSLPYAFLFKNGQATTANSIYNRAFEQDSYIKSDGTQVYPSKLIIEAWSSNEGFASADFIPANFSVWSSINIILNTSNLTHSEIPTSPSIPLTSDPIVVNNTSILLADFQNDSPKTINRRFGYNYYFADDTAANGKSTINYCYLDSNGADNTINSIKIGYSLKPGYTYPFIGFGLQVSKNATADLSEMNALEFWMKGNGTSLALEFISSKNTVANYYTKTIGNTTTEWTKYTIRFEELQQPNWGTTVNFIEVIKNLEAVHFKTTGTAPENGEFNLDQIRFVKISPSVPNNVLATRITDASALTYTINWDEVPAAKSYIILRKSVPWPYVGTHSSSTTDGTIIYQGNDHNYIDNDPSLAEDTIYYYTVFAINSIGESAAGKANPIYLRSGGLATLGSTVITLDSVIWIKNENGEFIPLRDNHDQYTSSPATLRFLIHSSVPTTNSTYTITLNITGAPSPFTMTFIPTSNLNTVDVQLILAEGLNNLDVSVTDWLNTTSNIENIQVYVAANIGLVPNSKILVNPMPYNPSLGSLIISFELTKANMVDIYLYDLNGRLVWRNAVNAVSGYNETTFNGRDSFGNKLGAGLYFIRIINNKSVLGTGKLLVTR